MNSVVITYVLPQSKFEMMNSWWVTRTSLNTIPLREIGPDQGSVN